MAETELVNLEVLKQKVSPEIWMEFCRESKICHECFSPLKVSRDDMHEIVCSRCGLVAGQELQQAYTLPGHGTDTSYNDTCNLAFGKSLGSHMRKYQTYSVLAKSANGKKDLGIRYVWIKEVTKTEPKLMLRLLSYGSDLCKEYGLAGKNERSVKFADELGRVLRVVGAVALALSRGTLWSKRLASSCFTYLYEKTMRDGHNLRKELKVTQESLDWIRAVLERYSLPRGIELFRTRDKALSTTSDLDTELIINPRWPKEKPMLIARKREI